ncbi:MAG: rod shape-determining protein MreD [Candidatus Omnitrophica bacterium]|nr:rod shape-determining protein MreD [Candidatus Omnitrophota bacterium]MDD5593038.1 rod shape-determining protein MreD [Candidatus Omnitrophota bacterium]
MKNWIFLGIIIICALLQATALNSVSIFGVKPDLLFIGVFYASIFFGVAWAVSLSIFAGFLKDMLCVNTFGVNTLLFPLFCLILIKLSREISLDNNFIRMLSLFILVLINDIIARVIFLFWGNFISWGIFLRTTFLEALYTAVVLPLVFKAIRRAL